VKETLTILNSINEKLGLVVEMLSADSAPVKPKYVEVAEKVLSVGNEALEEVIPAVIEEVSTETPSNETLEVGSIITYTGDREVLSGKRGTVVEVRGAWVVVAFDGEGKHTKCRKSELTLGANEQPPEQTEKEVVVAEEKAVAESLFDEEASSHKIEKGSFKEYRDIHAIYSDQKKMVGNRKYLRFRAKKVIGDDTLTQEMCHRYLIGIQDEEYLGILDARHNEMFASKVKYPSEVGQ
jgi:hypothetical protein|tara:strand:+ start:1329 stop:2042 length:714 start_codon:yes stop_codon:yes gene_type:complete